MRAIFCLLACAAVVIPFAGCGGSGDDTTAGATTGATDATVPAPPGANTGEEGGGASGGTGGSASELTPEQQVDYAIKGVLASGVPGLACEQLATEKYVKDTFGSRKGCIKSTVPGSAATYLETSKIEINGDEATAVARPTGGPSNGETIQVSLVREGGTWKVDSLKSNAPVGP